jgi:hypothetical protein
MSENIEDHGAFDGVLGEAYEKEDFVRVKGSAQTWLRIVSVGGLTLVATWVADKNIEAKLKEEE